MKYRLGYSAAVSLVVILSLAVLSLVSRPAAQNAVSAGKPTCIGCSPDGKTTPRTADGHPDLNGFWGGIAGVGNNIATRNADGSILFDFAGNQLGPDGKPTSSIPGEPG